MHKQTCHHAADKSPIEFRKLSHYVSIFIEKIHLTIFHIGKSRAFSTHLTTAHYKHTSNATNSYFMYACKRAFFNYSPNNYWRI